MFFNDPFMPLIIVALGFSFWAQWLVKSNFNKYSKVISKAGVSAAQIARSILNEKGLSNIAVERIPGNLTDNYDPKLKVLNLSSGVYDSTSIAAYGIAAHEAGHAIQHASAFSPLMLRNNFFPVASLGSNLAIPLFFVGILLSVPMLMDAGIVLFSFAVIFSVVTLPVEFDASNRALVILQNSKYLTSEEMFGAKKVLSAAALTYLAATLMAVLQLLRLFFLRNSRDD